MDNFVTKDIVETEEELQVILGGPPSKLAANKVVPELDTHCRHFLSHSPMLFLATSNRDGHGDVSPRGDAPGFVYIIDNNHILIPERPGNKRVDSLRNILSNPFIGLIFIIPNLDETLRINGKATVIRDEAILSNTAVNGRVPTLGIVVEIHECFIHCAKAFKRSNLWNPSTWPSSEHLPSIPRMLAEHSKTGLTEKDVDVALQESYKTRLY